jgi:predicted transcriptional regulator
MRKDSVFRVRMPSSEVAALKRVARERGQAASEYARRLIAEQVRRDEAARRVREALRSAPRGRLTDEEALGLADEAKHAGRAP